MNPIAAQLQELVSQTQPRLLALSEASVEGKPYDEKWCLKEILGHLIDSAANNHQRFVRLQQMPDIGAFTYKPEQWVSIQSYKTEAWLELVELWSALNRHLAHVIEHADPASMDHLCDMGYENPAPLRFIIEDYLRHVRHHLDQIFSNTDPRERAKWVRRDPRTTKN